MEIKKECYNCKFYYPEDMCGHGSCILDYDPGKGGARETLGYWFCEKWEERNGKGILQ